MGRREPYRFRKSCHWSQTSCCKTTKRVFKTCVCFVVVLEYWPKTTCRPPVLKLVREHVATVSRGFRQRGWPVLQFHSVPDRCHGCPQYGLAVVNPMRSPCRVLVGRGFFLEPCCESVGRVGALSRAAAVARGVRSRHVQAVVSA